MSPADCALEAVACLRAGANFREVYTLTRDLPDGLRWEWFDDGTGRLSMRHPTIDRHWEAFIPTSQVSAEEEQQVAAALVETLQAWVRHWQRDEQAALQGGRWVEDSTAGWADYFAVTPRTVTDWANARGCTWIRRVKQGRYSVNVQSHEASARRRAAEKYSEVNRN
jgi:hypothetical protein